MKIIISPQTRLIVIVAAILQLIFNAQNILAANPKTNTAKEIAEGKALFSQMNCASCHTTGADGGCLGPPLAGVGALRTKGFLQARLTNTKEAEEKFQSQYSYHAELMPHPRFAPETANKLIAYLLTLPAPKGGYKVLKHQATTSNRNPVQTAEIKNASASDIAIGARNFYKLGCAACHSIGNVGGSLGPSLDAVGSTRDLDYITDHITDAQFHTKMTRADFEQKPSKMPQFKATEKEIDQIAAFLYTLKTKK